MARDKPAEKPSAALYGARIARGPMGGDQYTQIHNNVFRDPRTSAKAKGVFGFCTTHQDGWHVTQKSIAKHMRDGVDAIAGALRELETYCYLIRFRERDDLGRYGEWIYFFTDLPAQLLDLELDDAVVAERVQRAFDRWVEQNTTSEPERRNPVQGSTSANADEDTAADAGPVDNSGPEERSGRSGPERGFPILENPGQGNPGTKKPNPPKTRDPEPQTGGDARPRTPQRNDAAATPRRLPEQDQTSPHPGTGSPEQGNQTARVDLAVTASAPVVDDLARLLSWIHPTGLSQQQAVTRAFRALTHATTGEHFRNEVFRYREEHAGVSVAAARDFVRQVRVLGVMVETSDDAVVALLDRAASRAPESSADAKGPASGGEETGDAGPVDHELVQQAGAIRAKYLAVEVPAPLVVAG